MLHAMLARVQHLLTPAACMAGTPCPLPVTRFRYWATGLNPSAAAFFIFVAIIICEVRWGGPGCSFRLLQEAAPESGTQVLLDVPRPSLASPQDLAGQALGLSISAAVPHEKIAMAIAPLVGARGVAGEQGDPAADRSVRCLPALCTLPFAIRISCRQVVVALMLFSGFYINSNTIPAALSWSECCGVRVAAARAKFPAALVHPRPLHEGMLAALPYCSQMAESPVLRPHGVRAAAQTAGRGAGTCASGTAPDPSDSGAFPTQTRSSLPSRRLAINDFRGRDGWACPVGSPPGCTVSGEAILEQLGFGGRTLGTAFMGLAVLTVSGAGMPLGRAEGAEGCLPGGRLRAGDARVAMQPPCCVLLQPWLACHMHRPAPTPLLQVGFNMLGYLFLRFRKLRYLPLRPAGKKQA